MSRYPPQDRLEASLEELNRLHELLETVGAELDDKQNEYDSANYRAISKAKGSNELSRKAEAYLAIEDVAHELTILKGKKDRIESRLRSNREVQATLRSLNANERNLT